jgi:hypothetical protein
MPAGGVPDPYRNMGGCAKKRRKKEYKRTETLFFEYFYILIF